MRAPQRYFTMWLAALGLFIQCPGAIAQAPGPANQNLAPASKVTLSLIVTDQKKHSSEDLQKDSISLWEEKTPQTISELSKDERPVDYALVIDNTGSFRKLLGAAVETARVIVSNNRDGDETFVERFISSKKVETVLEFTADKDEILNSLRRLYPEGGQSAIVDGVYVAAIHTAEYHQGEHDRRKALVLITDGEDRASYYTEDQLVRLLREKEVQIFVIGIVSELDDSPRSVGPGVRGKAENLLSRLAKETGGRAFFPRNQDELKQAAGEIVHDLHKQYLVSYVSIGANGKEYFRKVEVKITDAPGRDKLTAIARPGYFVNPPPSTPRKKDRKQPN